MTSTVGFQREYFKPEEVGGADRCNLGSASPWVPPSYPKMGKEEGCGWSCGTRWLKPRPPNSTRVTGRFLWG